MMIPDKHESFFLFIRKKAKYTRSDENIFLRLKNLTGICHCISSKKTYGAITDIAFDICRRTTEQGILETGFRLQGLDEIKIFFGNVAALKSNCVANPQHFPVVCLIEETNANSVSIITVEESIIDDKSISDSVGKHFPVFKNVKHIKVPGWGILVVTGDFIKTFVAPVWLVN